MDLINKTKAVKLRSHLGKYLVADNDRTAVRYRRNAAGHRSIWVVEPSAAAHAAAARFRNQATGLYLAASDASFLLGMTGKRVIQSDPSDAGEDNENFVFDWEPIRDGFQIMLKTKGEGRFLRANGGTPPWKNSVTHDDPRRLSGDRPVEAVDLPAEWVVGDLLSLVSSLTSSEMSEDESVSGRPRLSISR